MGYHIQLYRRLLQLALLALAILVLPWLLGQPLAAPAVLDSAALPILGPEGRADYARFLLQATPRAFAIAPDGNWGWASAIGGAAETTARALALVEPFMRGVVAQLDNAWELTTEELETELATLR